MIARSTRRKRSTSTHFPFTRHVASTGGSLEDGTATQTTSCTCSVQRAACSVQCGLHTCRCSNTTTCTMCSAVRHSSGVLSSSSLLLPPFPPHSFPYPFPFPSSPSFPQWLVQGQRTKRKCGSTPPPLVHPVICVCVLIITSHIYSVPYMFTFMHI